MLDLAEIARVKKALRGGNPSFPQEERELKDWICNHRQQGYVVTCDTIRIKAKLMINSESFHASSRRCHLKNILDTLLILVRLISGFNCRGAYWS